MLRKHWIHFVAMAALTLGAGSIWAQEPAPQVVPAPPPGTDVMYMQAFGPGPLGERMELLGFEGQGEHKVVTGTPFSATAISEASQTLVDGNTIHRTTQTALFRDGQGRVRREVTLPAIGPLAVSGKPHTFTSIADPVAGVHYILEPDSKIARKLQALGAGMHNRKGMPGDFMRHGPGGKSLNDVATESLGTQTINGVSAEGTRVTHTIPAGQIGNEKPITIVSERWYSPDLQMVVMSKRSDPRMGTTTYQLTNIQRSEPAATLFQVPADYTVKEGGPMGRKGQGMRGGQRHLPPPPPDAPPPPAQ